MPRKRFEWKIRDKVLQLGDRTLLVGVLNVTPDSFSDGGNFLDPDAAFAHAVALEDAGADILDIGAESTRPGSTKVPEAEELRRLVPVLKRLRGKLTIPISVDTYKSAVAEKAIELGADIINDPSGLTWDPDLARTASNTNAGLILNHMRGTPDQWLRLPPLKNPAFAITQELEASVHRATLTGLDRKRIVIDPGLGFGKRKDQNADILAHLGALSRLELPIMVGASRKHFLAKESVDQTEFAAAAVTVSILRGAHMIRVHDVAAMKVVAEVADEVLRAEAAAIEANAADNEDKNESRAGRREFSGSGPRNERTPLRPGRRPDVRPGTSPSGPPRPRNPR
jgi:dihydropteroate synthase